MLAGDVSQEGTLCGEEHPIFLRRKLTEPIEIKGQAAVLSVCNCRCYFHWMCQSLPRLYLLKCAGIGIDDVDRFIAPDLSQPFHGQTLEMLGIGPEKILQTRESIHIRVRSLAVSSLPGNSDEAFLWITRFLRESFLKGQARGLAVSPERIYVSRQDASHRRILNEEALVKFLQGFGFVSVTLSALTVKEQIGLFQGARVILGVHGAGMTNLAFCRPGTQVLEFFSPRYAYFCYRGIARAAGLDYRSFFGAGSQAKSTLTHRTFCEDIRVDLNGLYSAMREMKIAGESFNKTGNMLD
jgi:capsular polysaccharide biosynthesis protein